MHAPRMYLPAAFRSDDPVLLERLAREHPFATVIAVSDGAPEIAHLPCLVDGRRVHMHVARLNPLGELARAGARATVVLHGPHAYVSPRWYEQPDAQVPTWNYAVAHLSGVMRALDGEETAAHLRTLAARFEGPDGWSTDQLRDGLFEGIAKGVIGIALEVDRVETKLKLSQNRSPADHERVRVALAGHDVPEARAVADWMRATRA